MEVSFSYTTTTIIQFIAYQYNINNCLENHQFTPSTSYTYDIVERISLSENRYMYGYLSDAI